MLQLRAKNLEYGDALHLTRAVLDFRDSIFRESGRRTDVLINDNVCLALEVGADGVHLGAEDVSPVEARALLPEGALIGYSTHSLHEVRQAPISVLSYLGFGPVFSSGTKSGHAPTTGLWALRQAVLETPLPLVAIGGINVGNVASVYQTGAASVAVIGDLPEDETLEQKLQLYAELGKSC
jgi:thiamine-phosphate diphosphorylase